MEQEAFLTALMGSFSSALRWPQIDALWEKVAERPSGWYIYHVGEPPPSSPADPAALERFVAELDVLLRAEHDEDYCGIVYADNHQAPSLIKIYDPNRLGVVCGSSASPPLPGWVLTRIPPVDLSSALRPDGKRRRWWKNLFP